MFAKHQTKISEYARRNPDNFANVLKFVVLTIQNRLFNVPSDMETLLNAEQGKGNDEELRGILYGSKFRAITEINENKTALYEQAELIFYHAETQREAEESLLGLFATIHGIGLAKSGFCIQLIYGISGCLDSHNIARFGINPNKIKSWRYKNAKRASTKSKVIAEYCDLVDKCGGTETLWNSWCEYVANRPDETGKRMNGNKPLYKSANHVSALHCEALGIAA